jgi:glucosamine--fructose-6-phosphate aminotransferase (isomerizing)
VATLAALLRLAAAWTGSAELEAAVGRLPDRLATASELDWSGALSALASSASLVTIGRGPTLAVAREAALKLKETCNAALFTAEPGAAAKGLLPALASDHPETDAVCLIQSFYAMAVQLASELGMDASQPRHLNKITRTR